MKNGKRLKRADLDWLKEIGLNGSNWLISKRETYEWTLIHRETGRVKVVPAR